MTTTLFLGGTIPMDLFAKIIKTITSDYPNARIANGVHGGFEITLDPTDSEGDQE